MSELQSIFLPSSFDELSDGSIASRLRVWEGILNLSLKDWVFGIGAGNIDQKMDVWARDGILSSFMFRWKDLHSEFIWIWLCGRMVVVILYIWTFAGLLNSFFGRGLLPLGYPKVYQLSFSWL